MIVVVGGLAWRSRPPAAPAGRACGIALAAAARGARVELVGRAGDDAAGEALLLALAQAGVGHAAVLRDPGPTAVVDAPPGPSSEDDVADAPFADPDDGQVPPPAASFATTAASPRLDGADVDLAVRYLEPSGVLVVADDVPADALAAAVAASGYTEARLVVLLPSGGLRAQGLPAGLSDDATVLAAPPAADAEGAGAFDALVGAYAAALDAGADPAQAFASAQAATGWEAAAAD